MKVRSRKNVGLKNKCHGQEGEFSISFFFLFFRISTEHYNYCIFRIIFNIIIILNIITIFLCFEPPYELYQETKMLLNLIN